MAERLRHLVVGIVVAITLPSAASGQTTTLGDVVSSIEAASEQAGFASKRPELSTELRRHLETLKQSDLDRSVGDVSLLVSDGPRLSALARLRSGLSPVELDVALSEMSGIVENELRQDLQDAVGQSEATEILWPVTALYAELLDRSLEDSLEKLRRFERKFGPGSARLNGLEMAGNYLLQDIRHFGPDDNGWPGPLELIASYSPTYATYADDALTFVSVTEFGLRAYFFGPNWGHAGLRGLLKPSYTTFGMAVASGQDGALRWPWQDDARIGAFFSWGDLKVAYVGGDNQRFMVSRQFQLVPWVF